MHLLIHHVIQQGASPFLCSAVKRSAAAEPQQEPQDARPNKRARKAAAGPFHLATDQRGAAEEARIAGMRRQQEEVARREAEFKVGAAAALLAWHMHDAAHDHSNVPVHCRRCRSTRLHWRVPGSHHPPLQPTS